MQRWTLTPLGWVAVLSAAFVCAQEESPTGAVPSADAGKQLVMKAYQQSRAAASVEEFTQVIELCKQGLAGELKPATAEYARQLLSWAHNRRGESYAAQAADDAQQGAHEKAAELDARALADFESSIEYDPTRWKAIHNRGVSLAVAGKFEPALNDFDRVLELKPDYANAWFNRAEIHYERKDFEAAIKDYTESIRLKPEDAGAYSHRGHAYYADEQFRLAWADYDRAVEMSPTAETYADRADACRNLGRWSDAARDFRSAVEAGEASVRANHAAAWFMATCPDERFRNAELALGLAEKAIELAGQADPKLLDGLAAAYANADRFDEAQATLDKALKLASDSERDALQERRDIYRARRPYRQPVTEQAARSNDATDR